MIKKILYALAFLAGTLLAPLKAQTPDTFPKAWPIQGTWYLGKDTIHIAGLYVIDTISIKRGTVPPIIIHDSLWCTKTTTWNCSKTKPIDTVVTPPADTAPIPPISKGRPYGPTGLLGANVSVIPFTYSFDAASPTGLATYVAKARANKIKVLLALTGGSHSLYLTNSVFDRNKWNARMNLYNTPAIKKLIADGVADGTIMGASAMDEPNVTGLGDGNTWGPPGTMTKVRVDSLCDYIRKMFPTLPAGVVHQNDAFEPTKQYKRCQFRVAQYSIKEGDINSWMKGETDAAKRDGYLIMPSMNILDGGTRVSGCPIPATGGPGTFSINCRMTATETKNVGLKLISNTEFCGGLQMWRYDAIFMAKTDNKAAFKTVADSAAKIIFKKCG